ncbi:MAG: methyltransferase domain-containing protein [Alphaproteobacteria bacterium]|nr:methyltransferase domain-containing protein [Alphaproteobacteria bacterium]
MTDNASAGDPHGATLDYYNRNAEPFREGTRDHDVSQNIDALLSAIEGATPFDILDFGCGPGRDLTAFKARGHNPVGLDGAAEFARMAREQSGCEVLEQDFLALDLPPARFDGVFANATLFHIPRERIADVLRRLRATLKPRGVLFASNPRGNDEQGVTGGRFGCFWADETWCATVRAARFEEITRYWRPDGLPRDRQPWFATVWRKTA